MMSAYTSCECYHLAYPELIRRGTALVQPERDLALYVSATLVDDHCTQQHCWQLPPPRPQFSSHPLIGHTPPLGIPMPTST